MTGVPSGSRAEKAAKQAWASQAAEKLSGRGRKFQGTPLQAAEKGEILDETSKKHTAGAETHADSIGVMPGINPRHNARMSFSASCLAVPPREANRIRGL